MSKAYISYFHFSICYTQPYMSLPLAYREIEIYALSKKLALACYELTQLLPAEEKTLLFEQIRKTAICAHMHIAAAVSHASKKGQRKNFKIAKEYLVMLDAAIAIVHELKYVQPADILPVETLLADCYKLLTKQLKHQ